MLYQKPLALSDNFSCHLKKTPHNTYSRIDTKGCYIFDKQWNMLKQFFPVDCTIDTHHYLVLENGNVLFLASNNHTIPGKGSFKDAVIQEINSQGERIFQWNSKDHIPFKEFPPKQQRYTKQHDYFHANSLWIDKDDNILISSRNLDQIIKIDKKTGQIIWRLGGKSNDFTFINDPLNGFFHQHSISLLKNGNILLFDNGTFHTPPKSRIVEYALDQQQKTATLVWEYKHQYFYCAGGAAQRLPNGNTLITWGWNPNHKSTERITEITKDKEKVLTIHMPNGIFISRAYKFE